MTLPSDDYDGPAVIRAAGDQRSRSSEPPAEERIAVRVRLAGRFEPVDGRYHWAGRVAPDEAVARLLRAGHREVTIQIGPRDVAEARLAELDPWGGVRLTGLGRPPWADGREAAA